MIRTHTADEVFIHKAKASHKAGLGDVHFKWIVYLNHPPKMNNAKRAPHISIALITDKCLKDNFATLQLAICS